MSRLLFVGNLLPLPWEPGRGLFNWRQLRALSEQHDVTAVVPVPWQVYWRQPRAQRAVHERDGIRVVPVCYWYVPGVLRASYALTLFLSLLLAWPRLRAVRADAMLASWLYPDAVAATALARWLKIPVVMKAHGTDVNEQCQHPARRRQVAWAARRAAAVYTVSRDLAARLAAAGVSDNAAVIYNGIALDQFQPGDAHAARQVMGWPEGRLLLYVGNLKASKGVRVLVEALSRVSADACAHLYLVGDGPDRPALEALLRERGLTQRVTLLGQQSPDTVQRCMTAADALVLPSFAEGVPNVVLEAMACGRPVLATAVGGIPEVLPASAGVLVVPRDAQALASGIETLAAQSFDSAAIRAHASGFTWPENVAALGALLFPAESAPAGRRDHGA